MKIEEIKDNNKILAKVIRSQYWEDGLNFASADEDYQQVGFWGYDKGQKLTPHIHLIVPRQILKTQEVIFIKNGRLRADIYNEEEKFVKSVELKEGDAMIMLAGGHGYEILEDKTQVLEIKNGPYPGPEKDRKKINEK